MIRINRWTIRMEENLYQPQFRIYKELQKLINKKIKPPIIKEQIDSFQREMPAQMARTLETSAHSVALAGTYHVDQAGHELRDSPASASPLLGFHNCRD